MRRLHVALIPLFGIALIGQSVAAGLGFPAHAFAPTWTSLPTGSFVPAGAATVRIHVARVAPALAGRAALYAGGRMHRMLDEAFASAADEVTRREIALDEMMTSWDQPQRSALQRLREAEAAYAGGDDARRDRFAALLSRVVDGTGRSAASDDAAGPALATAYDAALSRQGDDARAATEATQTAFIAYRAAFAAFADGRSPGTGAGVADELDRQRAADLARRR